MTSTSSKSAVMMQISATFIWSADHETAVLTIFPNDEVWLYLGRNYRNVHIIYVWYSYAAWGHGDPHITTLDGRTYTFNGWGEYVVFQQQLDTNFMFQARTLPVANSSVTQFVAFAFGTPTADYIEVSCHIEIHK